MKTNIFKKTFQNFCLKKKSGNNFIVALHWILMQTSHLPDWSSRGLVISRRSSLNPCSIKIVQKCNMWYTQFAKWHKNIINENLLWPPLSSGEFYNLLHFDHHNHGALCHNARRPKLHTLCWYHHDDLDHNIASYAWFYV